MTSKCVVCSEDGNGSSYQCGPLCTSCSSTHPAGLPLIAVGLREKTTLKKFIFTKENWFLYPTVVKRLHEVGRPVLVEALEHHACCTDMNKGDRTALVTAYLGTQYLWLNSGMWRFSFPDPSIKLIGPGGQDTQTQSIDNYNSVCPRCGSPAYIGLSSVDCSNGCI
ncbi:MAG: hypothetical protein ACXABY_19980 [Candidatus Thorarchaeota archaeon]|jgi:hypothetical protein